MKVVLSCSSRFHAFDLARELNAHQMLGQLVTGYPKFVGNRFDVPSERISSLLPCELARRSLQIIERSGFKIRVAHGIVDKCYDKWASRVVSPSADIVVGWNSYCLDTLRTAKRNGAIAVCERGSFHIAEQDELLAREYESLGLPYRRLDKSILDRAMEEYVVADYICVPSKLAKASFERFGFDPSKIFSAHYGVDLSSFSFRELYRGQFRVVHCGAVSIQKGVHRLVQSFYELNLPDAELWLVGSLEPAMKAILHRYKSDRIKYLGTFNQQQLSEIYRQCSVLALCSIQDGFGMVVPQAMACGLPVILSNRVGAHEIVDAEIEGFVYDYLSTDSLKEKIIALYQDPELRFYMGSNAHRKVRAGLSWSDYGDKMAAFYRDCLGMSENSPS